jgi:MscS family membrane protein
VFRVRVKISVACGSDIRQVETVLAEQVRSNPLAAQKPEPRVRFRKYGDSSLDFELLCRAKRPHDRGRLVQDLNKGTYTPSSVQASKTPFPSETCI